MNFALQVLHVSGPYVLAALAGTFSELGGVINIALEGILLDGALAAVLAAYWTGSPWLGVLAGVAAGILTAALHAFACLRYEVDQVVSGLAVNFLAAGLCRFLLELVFGSSSNSLRVETVGSWGPLDPFLVLLLLLVLAAHWAVYKTSFGLRLRSVGEHPQAAATLGVPVLRMRLWGVLLSGALAGLGGAWMSLSQHQFTDGMSGGRGYIALAAVIIGGWTPLGAAAAALFFGAAEAAQIVLQTYGLRVPTQFVQMLPFALTLAAVGGLLGRRLPPAADGIPYSEEQD
ncbi:MAG: ABC transporter permease [Elusimicrobia bacterium]|nr:ABC transporter permease [Elusimicrobiota bacterium]MDE2426025.1 ABC transporter permease [Elusimicrobiota bacterium]